MGELRRVQAEICPHGRHVNSCIPGHELDSEVGRVGYAAAVAEDAEMTAKPVMATDAADAAILLSKGSKGIPFTSRTIVVELRQRW